MVALNSAPCSSLDTGLVVCGWQGPGGGAGRLLGCFFANAKPMTVTTLLSVNEFVLVSSLASIAKKLRLEEHIFNAYKNTTSIKKEEKAKSRFITLANNYQLKIKELERNFNKIFSNPDKKIVEPNFGYFQNPSLCESFDDLSNHLLQSFIEIYFYKTEENEDKIKIIMGHISKLATKVQQLKLSFESIVIDIDSYKIKDELDSIRKKLESIELQLDEKNPIKILWHIGSIKEDLESTGENLNSINDKISTSDSYLSNQCFSLIQKQSNLLINIEMASI